MIKDTDVKILNSFNVIKFVMSCSDSKELLTSAMSIINNDPTQAGELFDVIKEKIFDDILDCIADTEDMAEATLIRLAFTTLLGVLLSVCYCYCMNFAASL